MCNPYQWSYIDIMLALILLINSVTLFLKIRSDRVRKHGF